MRYAKFGLLALVSGCGIMQVLTPIPADLPDLAPIPGGITDQRPYYGTLKSALDNSDQADFLLATCGCGMWRVLVKTKDGSDQWQFAVHYLTPDGQDNPDGDVTVFGREDPNALLGTVDNSTGVLNGTTEHAASRLLVTAARRETHSNDAATCVACHVGENPIFPQPPGHPAFLLDPPNCLDCHTVVITK